MPPPSETNPPEDPATRLARIQDWSFQSGQASKELRWLRDFLRDKSISVIKALRFIGGNLMFYEDV